MRKANFICLILTVMFAGYSFDALAFSCYRHIYNRSQCNWTLTADTRYGNVYFSATNGSPSSCNVSCRPNGPCTLRPNCTYDLQYTYTGGYTYGKMQIMNWEGEIKGSWEYASRLWNLCPYIDGDPPPSVVFNSPANGDFILQGCGGPP